VARVAVAHHPQPGCHSVLRAAAKVAMALRLPLGFRLFSLLEATVEAVRHPQLHSPSVSREVAKAAKALHPPLSSCSD
jgi:hypothetical protein